jgi:hypothetical protein
VSFPEGRFTDALLKIRRLAMRAEQEAVGAANVGLTEGARYWGARASALEDAIRELAVPLGFEPEDLLRQLKDEARRRPEAESCSC